VAYFAGGCVRDRLRGVEPKDYDVATSAHPADVVALFDRTEQVGAAFGVVLVKGEGCAVEVATFREDLGIADGRHPGAVRFTDARHDAERRDFTINGMYEDPVTREVIDYVGGRRDLAARLVRTIGEPSLRFQEDRLRMLRAIRFATRFDFRIDPATMRAIGDHAAGIDDVSPERVREELTGILTSGRGGRGIGLLLETGLLGRILPEVAALDGVAQPPQFHPEGDVLTHTRMLLDDYRGGGETVALAALLHDIGKATTSIVRPDGRIGFPKHAAVGADMAGDVLRRLRYPNRIIDAVGALIDRHMDWPSLPQMRAAKQRRWLLREDFDLHLELHRMDCEACHRDLSLRDWATGERERLLAQPPPMRPLVNGHELKIMGFEPGPNYSRILEALIDAQLEERVTSREEARRFVKEHFAPPDGRSLAEDGES